MLILEFIIKYGMQRRKKGNKKSDPEGIALFK